MTAELRFFWARLNANYWFYPALFSLLAPGPREQRPDIVDHEGGKIHDTRYGENSTPAWGLLPGPGRAEVFVHPGAANGRLVADVVRIGKGHTEGLEPNVTAALVAMMVAAPGGRVRALG